MRLSKLLLLAWNIFLRDYRIRFRRTFLGIFWYLAPLLTIMMAAAFFGIDAGLYTEENQEQYIIKLISGIILWQLFSDTWLESLRFARRIRIILRSALLDPYALLLAGTLSALIGFLIRLPVLLTLFIYFDSPISENAILAPLAVLVLLAAGLIPACITLPISLNFLDIRYSVPLVNALLFLATPILYAHGSDGFVFYINYFNPLTYLIIPARDLFLQESVSLLNLMESTIVIFALLYCSLFYFSSKFRLAIAYIGR